MIQEQLAYDIKRRRDIRQNALRSGLFFCTATSHIVPAFVFRADIKRRQSILLSASTLPFLNNFTMKLSFIIIILAFTFLSCLPSTYGCWPATAEEVARIRTKDWTTLALNTNFPGKEYVRDSGPILISVAFYNKNTSNQNKALINTRSPPKSTQLIMKFIVFDNVNQVPIYFVADPTEKSCVLLGPVAELVLSGAWASLPLPR